MCTSLHPAQSNKCVIIPFTVSFCLTFIFYCKGPPTSYPSLLLNGINHVGQRQCLRAPAPCRGVTRKHRLHPASDDRRGIRFSPPAVLKVTCPPRGRGLMPRSHIAPPPTVTLSCHFQTGTELISQALLPR